MHEMRFDFARRAVRALSVSGRCSARVQHGLRPHPALQASRGCAGSHKLPPTMPDSSVGISAAFASLRAGATCVLAAESVWTSAPLLQARATCKKPLPRDARPAKATTAECRGRAPERQTCGESAALSIEAVKSAAAAPHARSA